MEEALLLARLCASVTVVHRRNTFRAGRWLQERVLAHSKISVRWNSEVQEFQGEAAGPRGNHLSGLLILDRSTGQISVLQADAAFVAIGHDPNTEMLRGQVRMNETTGYLETR